MLGTRGIWHDGWKAVTTHPALGGWGHYEKDTWELYHVEVDRSELHDLAAEEPERLAELIGLWFYEAGVNHAFPLDDRSALEIILTPAAAADRRRATGTSTGPAAPRSPSSSRSTSATADFTIGAQVDLPDGGARRVCSSRTAAGSAGTRSTSRTTGCTTSTTSPASSSSGSTPPRTCRPART